MTFDVAFSLGLRDTAATDYFGPINNVIGVASACRGGGLDENAFAVVRFEKGTSLAEYALVTSYRVGDDFRGDVVYFTKPPFEVMQ